MKSIDYSHYIRAQDCIAQGALTNSKRPECFVKGVYQTHASQAKGAFIHDVSGKRLVDFICGLGSSILGYGNQPVAEAIYQQATRGITMSLSSELEIELAEKIKEVIPWVQKMKFLKTGSEACSAAIKIARAKTGRGMVLSDGYHGWHDPFISLTRPAMGVPSQMAVDRFDNDLKKIDGNTAAVIVEPIMTDFSEERKKFLQSLRQKCSETGALLIFDEVITGFRTPKFTMSEFLGIEPDIICLGKAIANGMPLSVVAGKDEVMNCGEYFVSSTFAGEMCSMAAALSTITQLQTKKFNLAELWEAGDFFIKKFNLMYPEKIKIVGYPTRGVFEGDPYTKALLWQEAYNAHILLGSSFFFNFAHLPYMDRILNSLQDIVMRIKTGNIALKGELPQSPFAQKIRGDK